MSRLLTSVCLFSLLSLPGFAETPETTVDMGKTETNQVAAKTEPELSPKDAIEQARAALTAGDANGVEALLLPLAEAGSLEVLRELSRLYREAEGPMHDPERARALDEKAWGLGDVYAGTRVAGDLLETDPERARALLEEASKLEGFKAWMVLGQLRLTGTGGAPDEAGAAQAFSTARDAGEHFALIHLARMARDGRGLPQNGADAVALFEDALETTPEVSEVALRELISGHGLGLFGAASDPKEAIELGRFGLQKGSVGASLGILGLPKRLETIYPDLSGLWEPAITLAEAAADKGDPMAARRILGYWHVASLEDREAAIRAATAADRYADILDPGQLQRHRVVYAAMNGASPSDIAATFKDAKGKEAAAAIFDLQKANLNAYVAVLQTELSRRGLYDGATDGRMNKRTISAIKGFCREAKIEEKCDIGPLSWQAAQAIGVALMMTRS